MEILTIFKLNHRIFIVFSVFISITLSFFIQSITCSHLVKSTSKDHSSSHHESLLLFLLPQKHETSPSLGTRVKKKDVLHQPKHHLSFTAQSSKRDYRRKQIKKKKRSIFKRSTIANDQEARHHQENANKESPFQKLKKLSSKILSWIPWGLKNKNTDNDSSSPSSSSSSFPSSSVQSQSKNSLSSHPIIPENNEPQHSHHVKIEQNNENESDSSVTTLSPEEPTLISGDIHLPSEETELISDLTREDSVEEELILEAPNEEEETNKSTVTNPNSKSAIDENKETVKEQQNIQDIDMKTDPADKKSVGNTSLNGNLKTNIGLHHSKGNQGKHRHVSLLSDGWDTSSLNKMSLSSDENQWSSGRRDLENQFFNSDVDGENHLHKSEDGMVRDDEELRDQNTLDTASPSTSSDGSSSNRKTPRKASKSVVIAGSVTPVVLALMVAAGFLIVKSKQERRKSNNLTDGLSHHRNQTGTRDDSFIHQYTFSGPKRVLEDELPEHIISKASTQLSEFSDPYTSPSFERFFDQPELITPMEATFQPNSNSTHNTYFTAPEEFSSSYAEVSGLSNSGNSWSLYYSE